MPASEPEAAWPDAVTQRRVLLVDDPRSSPHPTAALLETLGCRVITVADRGTALTVLAEPGIALVFLDCRLPHTDGCETAASIRYRERRSGAGRVPIVALTPPVTDGRRWLASGMDDWITVPPPVTRLGALVDRWLTGGPPSPGGSRPGSGTATGPNQVLEAEALASMSQLDRETRTEIIQLYAVATLHHIREIRDALERRDAPTVTRAAHALRSASVNLGIGTLAALGHRIETLGRAGALATAAPLLDELEVTAPQVLDGLDHLIAEPGCGA